MYDALRVNHHIDIVKMDIEGAEMAALLGMNKVIARSPRLAMFTEFYPGALERAGVSPADYFNELQRHGFNIYLIDEQRQWWEAVSDIAYLTNYLMIRKILGANLLCVKGKLIDENGLLSLGKSKSMKYLPYQEQMLNLSLDQSAMLYKPLIFANLSLKERGLMLSQMFFC